jgi:hypothetical protein
MIIEVSYSGCRLLDVDNFRELKITSPSRLTGNALDAALVRLGHLTSATGALVSPEALRALADRDADAAWIAGYTTMLAQARVHGWIEEPNGAIKVHVEFV